jgi:hypothetical protein
MRNSGAPVEAIRRARRANHKRQCPNAKKVKNKKLQCDPTVAEALHSSPLAFFEFSLGFGALEFGIFH